MFAVDVHIENNLGLQKRVGAGVGFPPTDLPLPDGISAHAGLELDPGVRRYVAASVIALILKSFLISFIWVAIVLQI